MPGRVVSWGREARLRVALFEAGGWGGIAHYTHNLSVALSENGSDVHLITARPYELSGSEGTYTVHPVMSQDRSYLENIREAAGSINAIRPQVLHVQSTLAVRRDWAVFLALKARRLPAVYTAHNVLPHDEAERSAPGMVLGHNLLYRFADHVIVHGDNIRSELLARFRPNPSRVSVIPHGDYTFARPRTLPSQNEARNRLGLPPGSRVLLAFGAIRDYKGLPDLVDGLGLVREQASDTHLVIAGKPHRFDLGALRDRVRARGLQEAVTLHPYYVPMEDIPIYFQAADIAVYPYRAIAQSGSLQLAYAFGKPVVVTRVGSLAETVEEGGNGTVVPPASPDELAQALIRLLGLPPDRLLAMGERSAQLAASSHSWDDIARSTLGVYETVLQRPRWALPSLHSGATPA